MRAHPASAWGWPSDRQSDGWGGIGEPLCCGCVPCGANNNHALVKIPQRTRVHFEGLCKSTAPRNPPPAPPQELWPDFLQQRKLFEAQGRICAQHMAGVAGRGSWYIKEMCWAAWAYHPDDFSANSQQLCCNHRVGAQRVRARCRDERCRRTGQPELLPSQLRYVSPIACYPRPCLRSLSAGMALILTPVCNTASKQFEP